MLNKKKYSYLSGFAIFANFYSRQWTVTKIVEVVAIAPSYLQFLQMKTNTIFCNTLHSGKFSKSGLTSPA
jgi:hypothetical protein